MWHTTKASVCDPPWRVVEMIMGYQGQYQLVSTAGTCGTRSTTGRQARHGVVRGQRQGCPATHLTPGMVMDVSAMLVARMALRCPGGGGSNACGQIAAQLSSP